MAVVFPRHDAGHRSGKLVPKFGRTQFQGAIRNEGMRYFRGAGAAHAKIAPPRRKRESSARKCTPVKPDRELVSLVR